MDEIKKNELNDLLNSLIKDKDENSGLEKYCENKSEDNVFYLMLIFCSTKQDKGQQENVAKLLSEHIYKESYKLNLINQLNKTIENYKIFLDSNKPEKELKKAIKVQAKQYNKIIKLSLKYAKKDHKHLEYDYKNQKRNKINRIKNLYINIHEINLNNKQVHLYRCLVIPRILLKVILWIIGILLIIIVGYNCIKFIRYSSYYSIHTNMRNNPGANDGFITQGLCYMEDEDLYLTSGYMTDKKKASRIYIIDKNNKERYASLKIQKDDGSLTPCYYHCGGMSYEGNNVYIASGSKIHILDKEKLLNDNEAIITKSVSVNNSASFVFTTSDSLYVGEFNDDGAYKTKNEFTNTDNETTKAIISQYTLSSIDSGTPELEHIYSIRNKVQGFCITSSGKFVMDTSWAISSSHFYVYDNFQNKQDTTITYEDKEVPVTYLDSRYLIKDIKGPSMAEDLDYHNGKVLVASESASNKYIFGKLFFYWYINGLTIN